MNSTPIHPQRFVTIAIPIALAFLACAFVLDRHTASIVRSSGCEDWLRSKSHDFIRERLKDGGYYTHATIAIAIVISFIHRARWRAGYFLLANTAVVSGINWCIKWFAGRLRPFRFDKSNAVLAPFDFQPFRGGLLGGFGPNLSFPSGHTMLAFATAATLVMLFPRWTFRGVCYAFASIVAAERVLENAHWLSDVVAGMIVGVGGAHLVAHVAQRIWPRQTNAVLLVAERTEAGAGNVDD